jgi:prepilin signal peptidase PulO-like enzyme (type II secretory pathway)
MLKGLDEKIDTVLLISVIASLFGFKYFFWVNLTDIAILNGLIWALAIFTFFFLQILVSKWAWLGWGDLRIAIMIGLALWTTLAFPGMMLTYLSGTVLSLGYLGYSKWKHKDKWFDAQVPFGPFLAIGFFITMFYQTDISNLMAIYF